MEKTHHLSTKSVCWAWYDTPAPVGLLKALAELLVPDSAPLPCTGPLEMLWVTFILSSFSCTEPWFLVQTYPKCRTRCSEEPKFWLDPTDGSWDPPACAVLSCGTADPSVCGQPSSSRVLKNTPQNLSWFWTCVSPLMKHPLGPWPGVNDSKGH